MDPVRIYGDPFGPGAASRALRTFAAAAAARGLEVAVCTSPLRYWPPEPGPEPGTAAGARPLVVTVHGCEVPVPSALSAAALGSVRAQVANVVPATAPVVVFAPPGLRADAMATAALEWPLACSVTAGDGSAAALVDRVVGDLRRAGTEDPDGSCDAATLQQFAALRPPPADGPVLHVGGDDPAAGTDIAVRAFAARMLPAGRRLRIVLPPGSPAFAQRLRQLAADRAPGCRHLDRALEFEVGPLRPVHLRDCAAALMPLRLLRGGEPLPQLLASGRPLLVTRTAATAPLLGGAGVVVPIGGRPLAAATAPAACEPDLRDVVAALRRVGDEPEQLAAIGARGREHALQELVADRPARPARPPARSAVRLQLRSRVVLEAPWFASTAAAAVAIETARALQRRGKVELQLVPTAPFAAGVDALRRRAPELVPLLAREPGDVDLWLASGWPLRAARPRCHTFGLRVGWGYGALPGELAPLATHDADVLLAPSAHVARTLALAGCGGDRVLVVPHGVDGSVFNASAGTLPEIGRFKGTLPAVLFVGAFAFRKGFDVLLRAALDAAGRGARFCVVLKHCGDADPFAQLRLGSLVERFAATPGAPPVLTIERDMTRADLARLYRSCDLLCQPYRGEGFGLPVLEAMACGLPAVVTAGGATDDFATGPGVVQVPAQRRAIDLPGAWLGQPWVLEPDAAAAGRELASAVARVHALRVAAETTALRVRTAHSWDVAAAAIERVCEQPRLAGPVAESPLTPATRP